MPKMFHETWENLGKNLEDHPKMCQDLMDLWTRKLRMPAENEHRYKMIQGTSHPPFFLQISTEIVVVCSDLCQFTQRSMWCSQDYGF